MQAGLVSIMMPAYNAERYIGPAIESVLSQSYSHWELIIVNDGSQDNTAEIATHYTNDPRVKLIHQANAGEAAARNVALAHMQGDYISFLDADDLYLPDALADRCKFLEEHPEYGVMVSDGKFCDENGNLLGHVSAIRTRKYTGNILEPLVLNPSVVSVPVGITARHTLIERHQFQFDPEIGYGTDWDFWIQLARYTQFGYLDKLTYLYRVHYTNMTRNTGRQKVMNNWIRGRKKILNSDWFSELSIPTQKQFFYDFLINLLTDQPIERKAVFEHQRFQKLPAYDQAQIWRQVGVHHLLIGSDYNFGVNCLQRAINLWPDDWKTRSLFWSLQFGELPTWTLLRLWRITHNIVKRLRLLGQHRSKPVPPQLRPARD